MKIIAIGAHPDDIEIFMYGLLSIYKNRGDEIYLAVATDGSAGGNADAQTLIGLREQETIKALSLLGNPNLMGFRDGYLISEINAFPIIKNYILSIKPDLIITHDPKDYHADHRALSNFVLDSVGFICPVLFCDTLLGINFNPDFYFDITSSFERKKKAILCHNSQNPQKFFDAISLQNSFRSAQCNLKIGKYAECYRHDKIFPFSDVRSLLPNTIKHIPYYENNNNALV